MSTEGRGSGARRAVIGACAVLPWLALAFEAPGDTPSQVTCSALVLPVQQVGPPPTAYSDFCRAHPDDCRAPGPAVVPASAPLWRQLSRVNREVNASVRFMPDIESVGQEEDWRYPLQGRGDCEDLALEKRRRLVALGLPRAALTMAIVHHTTRYFSHAVLLVETSAGTWMLDSLSDDIACWDRTPFNFESRERSDGRWDRFDQSVWRHGPPAGAVPGPC